MRTEERDSAPYSPESLFSFLFFFREKGEGLLPGTMPTHVLACETFLPLASPEPVS